MNNSSQIRLVAFQKNKKSYTKLICNILLPRQRTARLSLKCDGTRAETRLRLSAKRTSPFKSVGVSAQSTTGSRGVRISGSNAGYNKFRSSVKVFGYPLHSPVSPSLLSRASHCAITFQLDSTSKLVSYIEINDCCRHVPLFQGLYLY